MHIRAIIIKIQNPPPSALEYMTNFYKTFYGAG